MPKTFIHKTEQIILSNLEEEGFGVSDLAKELGLSRSQVLRKIKASTGKSVNLFIREIRLREAVKHIQNSELTAAEIAFKVGFSSPSYFNRCFNERYNCTPGDFRKNYSNGKLENDEPHERPGISRGRRSRLILITGTSLTLIMIFFILFGNSLFPKEIQGVQQASIAVLPFLDLSDDQDQEHVSDGITDAITLELSRRNTIRVISRTSAMRYKGEKLLSSVIAEELGVNFLLEGSVLHSSDSLRVVVQLIEPFPHEKHLWAESYDQKYADVLHLVKKISNQIADEVNLAVIPEESNIEVYPVNKEAFDLYLKARHLWNQQNTRSVKSAVAYLKESIQIDSGFAPAYVTLAEAYISLNKLIRDNVEKLKHREYSRSAIGKALELDPDLASAYITRGNIAAKFDWDWKEMKKMTEKGLDLNPNDAYGYLLLSTYYLVNGDFDKALEMALISESLDPLNPMTACLVAERYFMVNDFKKSIAQYQQVLELFPKYGFAWDGIGYAQFMSGARDEAMISWRELHIIMGNESSAEIFATETIDVALHYWIEKAKSQAPQYCSNPTIIAMAHMFVNDTEGAMEYLDIAYKYRNEDLPKMMLRPHWKPLYGEPRFQELALAVGVSINY